jgi:hypothetical protein
MNYSSPILNELQKLGVVVGGYAANYNTNFCTNFLGWLYSNTYSYPNMRRNALDKFRA